MVSVVETEEEPLLSRRRSSDSIGLPGSHRRRLSTVSTSSRRSTILENILEEGPEEESLFKKNVFTILAVVAVGVAGWAIAWQSGVWVPAPTDDVPVTTDSSAGASILGYTSAICYLGYVLILSGGDFCLSFSRARIPQILKNYRDKSCEGKIVTLLSFE